MQNFPHTSTLRWVMALSLDERYFGVRALFRCSIILSGHHCHARLRMRLEALRKYNTLAKLARHYPWRSSRGSAFCNLQ